MKTNLLACLACVLLVVASAPAVSASEETAAQLVTRADALYQQDDLVQAEAAVATAIEAARAQGGPDSADEGSAAMVLAWIRYRQNRYPEAEAQFRRALALAEANREPVHADVALALTNLGFMLNDAGQFAEAEQLLRRALVMRETLHGPVHPEIATVLGNLGSVYNRQDRHAEGEPLLRRALAIAEATRGPEHIDVALALNDLGLLMSSLARYDEAKALLERALDIARKAEGPDRGTLGAALLNMAGIHAKAGRYAQAEPLMLEALAIGEGDTGPESQEITYVLNQLGLLYDNQGRYEDAIKMHSRALAIREKVLGADHDDVGTSLNNLGMAYEGQGRLAEAAVMYQRDIAIYEKRYGPEDPGLAASLGNLAINFLRQGKPAEAEPYALRALAIHEAALGPDHPDTLNARNTVAGMYSDQGKFDLAEPLFRSNIAALEAKFGPDYPRLALDLTNLGLLFWKQDRPAEGLVPSRQAVALLRRRFVDDGLATLPAGLAELRASRPRLHTNIYLLGQLASRAGPNDAIASESFETGQLARASSVGDNVAQMAARFAGGDDALATQVRALQDARQALAAAQAERIDAIGLAPSERDVATEAKLGQRIDALHVDIESRSLDLAERFPEYAALVSQAPVSAAQAQALLGEDEALVVYTVAKRMSFAWVVRRDRIDFHTLTITDEELANHVQFLRAKLAPDARGALSAMTPATASGLYDAVFAALEPGLTGARRVFLVADGALQALPFAVLGAGGEARREWLGRRYAFAMLPSVGALRALRRFPPRATAPEPFAGFGDPVLGDAGGMLTAISTQDVFTTRSLGPGLADVDALREAPSLPETADELRALAAALHGAPDAVFLQERATETQVKHADLGRFRFLAFATHGVMAGELAGADEPGLVLTPPAVASAEDDGYLAASEVAALQLRADWVVLSACNTAAADGTPGAEGLSGLANAFFYAGSRALLVSHWPVASLPTRELVTAAVGNYAARPDRGKPQALHDAMIAMMANPQYEHPFYWAPFTVVGD